MTPEEKETALFDEMVDVEYEMANQLRILIDAEWDSDTVKTKLQKIMKDFEKLNEEIEKLDVQS